jgi:ElaB/YqjD/DUF883 family membrane-anchored ribosome-binding protein
MSEGYTPFYFRHDTAILAVMRKTGNGQHVDLEQFLTDIRTVIRDGEEFLKASASHFKERAIAGAKSADQLIRDRPYPMIAIIFGLGFLAGMLLAGHGVAGEETERD